jgi:signal transduction histidine kinase
MKTILALGPHPEFAESIRAALGPERYRVIHRADAEEAEPLLQASLVDVCLVDVEHAHVQGIWMVEKLRRRLPACPLLVFTATKGWEWEEEAYLQGTTHVLAKPVRPKLLVTLLDRLGSAPHAPAASAVPAAPFVAPPTPSATPGTEPPATISSTLAALRDLSGILGHSLCADALLKQFLLSLREVIGVNRCVLFLRQPDPFYGSDPSTNPPRSLRSACAIGLPQGLLDHLQLSQDNGIGGHIYRSGRILRRESREAQGDPAAQKEFEVLGVQVALPIPDRETLVGIALFDGRVTGEPISNTELELVFHLLEALGLAIRNIWLHDQLAANSDLMSDVLRQLSSGCVVVSRDLRILHVNKAARSYFGRSARSGPELEFPDLPAPLATKIYQVLKTGTGITPFEFRPGEGSNRLFEVSIVPIHPQRTSEVRSVLMIIEDRSQAEQFRRLEVETANLRLVKQMADRLAHEIGNALVPLSTHQQLFAKRYDDPEFRASLDAALAEGVRRVSRLINQMRFLARDRVPQSEQIPLAPLLEEAYQEAQKHQTVKSAQLKYNIGKPPLLVQGDRASLKHAISEVMLNALQANPGNARIAVETQADTDRNGTEWLHIDFRDNGAGFSPEAVRRIPEPFYTTRNVGLGLGLVVTRKVLEAHRGRLEIFPPGEESAGIVRLSLPREAVESADS